jgi:hypothetical protein
VFDEYADVMGWDGLANSASEERGRREEVMQEVGELKSRKRKKARGKRKKRKLRVHWRLLQERSEHITVFLEYMCV